MNDEMIKQFSKKLQTGAVFGPFMKTGDPAFVEAAGYGGCDFAVLDMEHGPVSLQEMQNNIRAAQVSGLLPIIRVSALSETAISQALDIGAGGVQVPQISTAAQARLAVKAAKFYPCGDRGVCRFVRAAHYSTMDKVKYFIEANRALMVIQIEGQEAVDNLDEILSVDGIDIIFIGPYDLSQSMGLPGQVTNPKVIEQMKKIVEHARKYRKIVGTFTDSPEMMKLWLDAGVQYISYSVDVGIFAKACADLKSEFDLLRA